MLLCVHTLCTCAGVILLCVNVVPGSYTLVFLYRVKHGFNSL